MAMQVLYRAGVDPWADLKGPMLEAIMNDHKVLWLSGSGTVQLYALASDRSEIVRVRRGVVGSQHPTDGLPVVIPPEFFATTCGAGDPISGYRSSPPLLLSLVDTREDIDATLDHEVPSLVERLNASSFSFADIPDGHPDEPCPALWCPLTTAEDQPTEER